MIKARLIENGSLILAQQYNPAAHGKDLHCADPNCEAVMGYRREAITHGAQALKEAHFFSRDKHKHVKNCRAHDELPIRAAVVKSLEEALAKKRNIVINLNFDLTGTFANVVKGRNLVCASSTYSIRNYKSVGIKSIENVLKVVDIIRTKGDAQAMQRAYVNYKGRTMLVDDFIIDSAEKYTKLHEKMQRRLKADFSKSPEQAVSVSDYPHLISFRPTMRSRDGAPEIRGTPMTVARDGNSQLIIVQRPDVDAGFENAFRNTNLFVLAEPTLFIDDLKKAEDKMTNHFNGAIFMDMHWKIVTAHQFTPMEQQPKKRGRKPAAPDAV
jgi:hypothetical protein